MSALPSTIFSLHKALIDREVSSVELTQAHLQRIHKTQPTLNAFISIFDASAEEEAKQADIRLRKGEGTPLTGIPFSVKDTFCTMGTRSTGASMLLDTYSAPYEATPITRIRAAGAVLLGKNNADTFGHGASTENSMYGVVRNPHDTSRVAGGSSGGSAAAVAADLSVFAIAEDTGGSIRQPSSFCGITGIRPTYGRVSRYGSMPMASSLDTVGPMARTVEDVAYLLSLLAGYDPRDATSAKDVVPAYHTHLADDLGSLRIGIPKEYFEAKGLDDTVRASVQAAITTIERMGVELVEVSLPHTSYAIPTYYLLVYSEDSSNLARLDGIRYGTQLKGDTHVEEIMRASRHAGFPDEVKRRIMMGTFALSAGYYDAYYKKAQRVRTKIRQDFDRVFETVDLLLTPTSPFPAFGVGEKKDDILAMYLADIFLSPASLAGLPALSVPCGTTDTGLPIGLQIIGNRFDEQRILQLGHQYTVGQYGS